MEDLDFAKVEGSVGEMVAVGSALGGVKTVKPGWQEKQFVIVPEGYTLHEVETEGLLPVPWRNKGTVIVATVDSFLLFVKREFIPETTVCFADLDKGSFYTIFNYAANGTVAGWADRRVFLNLEKTTSWNRWMGKNNISMDQLSFADFIEANMADISSPPAAEIIELTKQLKVHRSAEFSSVVDPKTGFTNLAFSEKVSGETLQGNIEFCGQMVLGLAPFRGSDPYAVNARIRFKLTDNNKLHVYFTLVNADLVEEDAFNHVRRQISASMEEMTIPVFDV